MVKVRRADFGTPDFYLPSWWIEQLGFSFSKNTKLLINLIFAIAALTCFAHINQQSNERVLEFKELRNHETKSYLQKV